MVDFPSTLPGPDVGSLNPTLNDGIVRDSGEIGPPRSRRRTTRVLKNWSFTITLESNDQKAIWDTFYETDLNYGISNFNWTLLGETYTVQFLEQTSPVPVEGEIWRVSLNIGEV